MAILGFDHQSSKQSADLSRASSVLDPPTSSEHRATSPERRAILPHICHPILQWWSTTEVAANPFSNGGQRQKSLPTVSSVACSDSAVSSVEIDSASIDRCQLGRMHNPSPALPHLGLAQAWPGRPDSPRPARPGGPGPRLTSPSRKPLKNLWFLKLLGSKC